MNKKEVVKQVAEKSGIDIETCRKVIDTLEKVVGEGLADKLKFWKKKNDT